jgi:hypothetical protein
MNRSAMRPTKASLALEQERTGEITYLTGSINRASLARA